MHRSRPYPPVACLRAALLGPLAVLTACGQTDRAEGNEPAAATGLATDLPPVPRAQAPLDRAAILAAVARVASAAAAGDREAADRTLDGRQFEFRIRFGCGGPSSDLRDEWLGWSYDGDSATLRVRARPTISAPDELLDGFGSERFEAVEGFWIPRPWLLEAVCPAGAAPRPEGAAAAIADSERELAAERVPNAPRIGIAQFFTETDPRTQRRSMRPYDAVKTLEPDQPVGSQGFNLVLSGRLKALPGGAVVTCLAKSAYRAPDCIVSVDFDRVWIEAPGDRAIIAEWGGG